jgi:hypothetical protein
LLLYLSVLNESVSKRFKKSPLKRIRTDAPIDIDLDKITEEIGKLLSSDDVKFTIEDIQDLINSYSSSFSETYGISAGVSDCEDSD